LLTTTAIISREFNKQLSQGFVLAQGDILFAQKIQLGQPLLDEGHHVSTEAIHRLINVYPRLDRFNSVDVFSGLLVRDGAMQFPE